MGRVFEIFKREGRHGLDFIVQSRVTGEVFFLLFDSHDPEFPIFSELRKMYLHYAEVYNWVKDGVIAFAGDQVVYKKVYY